MKRKILVVDDEKAICSVVAAYLEDQGYATYEANSLAAARHHLKEGVVPDLVLLDVMLGDGNGILFLREIREMPAFERVPVIIMSAYRTKSQDKVAGLKLGADDYITKPFDLREIDLRIEKLLKHYHPEPVISSEAKTESVRPDDLASALKGVLKKQERGSFSSALPPAPKPIPEALYQKEAFGKKLISILLDPILFLSHSSEKEMAHLSLLCLSLAGVLRGLQEGFADKSVSVGFVNMIVYPLAYGALVGFGAWIIQWSGGLRQKSYGFKPLCSALGIAFAPLAVAAALGLLYVVVASGRAGDFTAGILLLSPSQASSKYFGFILRRLDIFEIWSVWLATLSLRHVLGASYRKIFFWVFSVWIILVLCSSFIIGLFV